MNTAIEKASSIFGKDINLNNLVNDKISEIIGGIMEDKVPHNLLSKIANITITGNFKAHYLPEWKQPDVDPIIPTPPVPPNSLKTWYTIDQNLNIYKITLGLRGKYHMLYDEFNYELKI